MKSLEKKIALVYDSDKGSTIANLLKLIAEKKGYCIITFDAREKPMDPCIGCFNCWVKTPGICSQTKTDSYAYLKQVYNASFIIHISKVTFGGFSSKIKGYMERLLPLAHPYFRKQNGEMHHVNRYKLNPNYLAIGYDCNSSNAEKIFVSLANRNMINSGHGKFGQNHVAGFIYKGSENELTSWFENILEA